MKREGGRCPACNQRVPLVEAGEHDLTCPGAELHPFDLIGVHEDHDPRSRKKSAGSVEQPPSGSA